MGYRQCLFNRRVPSPARAEVAEAFMKPMSELIIHGKGSADDIDKKGPDRATDMQVQLTAPLLCCFTVEPLLTAVQGSQVCPEHRHHGQTGPGRTEQTQDAMT